ncbi:hypothetical protein [Paenibacillus sp. USDA918EY]|nr:hypothetical protein [Paenibacillus sp. USDA918EY]
MKLTNHLGIDGELQKSLHRKAAKALRSVMDLKYQRRYLADEANNLAP